MPLTTLWIRTGFTQAKPIWHGDIPHVLRAGDDIVIVPNLGIERVESATYDIATKEVDARIAGVDETDRYPAIGEGI